jgi:hypothetical protein
VIVRRPPKLKLYEEGILLALQHCDRVRRIGLRMPISGLRRSSMAMDEEFPILESVYRFSQTEDHTGLILPKTLQAPHLSTTSTSPRTVQCCPSDRVSITYDYHGSRLSHTYRYRAFYYSRPSCCFLSCAV